MKEKLTDRQQEVLDFILHFRTENGYPPTLREIGKKLDVTSTFGVKRHLEALAKKGYLSIESNASRGINLLKHSYEEKLISPILLDANLPFRKIPVVGRVAAGFPILAEQNIEGSIVIDESFIKKSEDCFALKVKGDSMINAGLFEGDLVIVHPQKQAFNGEIVVALLGDEATVKTFEIKNNKVRLIPENDKYKPIDITGDVEFSLVGKVIGMIRWFN